MTAIRVNVFDETGCHPVAENIDLREAIGDDDDEYEEALSELRRNHRYWGGGGASPLYLLVEVRS